MQHYLVVQNTTISAALQSVFNELAVPYSTVDQLLPKTIAHSQLSLVEKILFMEKSDIGDKTLLCADDGDEENSLKNFSWLLAISLIHSTSLRFMTINPDYMRNLIKRAFEEINPLQSAILNRVSFLPFDMAVFNQTPNDISVRGSHVPRIVLFYLYFRSLTHLLHNIKNGYYLFDDETAINYPERVKLLFMNMAEDAETIDPYMKKFTSDFSTLCRTTVLSVQDPFYEQKEELIKRWKTMHDRVINMLLSIQRNCKILKSEIS